ncbi:MAG: phosphoribosylformylglycinamidine cyclo-ligase [Mycoplasmataceae bacterium]|jgi:phosphoribosylformylglycinamidine cyclo-ligase|nr:phosphoribosylformylglycinamidine cyclo-ligase [Mycoplasmataceae bacterium]
MSKKKLTYEASGVNIHEGYKEIKLIKTLAKSTYNSNVLNSLGSFAGMVKIPKGMKEPIMVSGTDGVGTKIAIACKYKKYNTVGIDCVAMCVNDVLCHGATPSFFLDYIACGKLDALVARDLVKGVTEGCKQANSSLIGGETAEMPGIYKPGDYDLAGFSVGLVEKNKIINGKNIKPGGVLIGIASSGCHSNGFSLIRKAFTNMNENFENKPIWKTLLTPTKIYVKPILALMKKVDIKGMAHITGGGFIENAPRMLSKKGLTLVIKKNSYPIPSIFKEINKRGVDINHMYNTFNMGIGFIVCVDKKDVIKTLSILKSLKEKAYEIGYIKKGNKEIELI